VVVDRMPLPARIGFAARVAPHLVELGAEPTPHFPFIRTPYLHLDLLGMKVLHRAMIHRLQGRYLFLFVDHRSGADMQHARRIANATGVHRHIDDLLLDLRRLTGVALHQQKGPSTPREAHTAPIALLAFRRQTMLDNIGPLAIRAVQHLRHHRCSFSHGWFSSAQTSTQDNRSTALKHLRLQELRLGFTDRRHLL